MLKQMWTVFVREDKVVENSTLSLWSSTSQIMSTNSGLYDESIGDYNMSAENFFGDISTTNDSSVGTNTTLLTLKWMLLGVAICILIFVFLPFSIYYSWKIYRYRYSIIVHKRFPYLILVTVIGNCIYLSTEKTVMLLIAFKVISCPMVGERQLIEFIILGTIHWVFIYALYLTVLRFWLLYFKLEWALSNINNRWQSIISSRTEYQDWFLRNKKTYGSYTWLIKKVLIFTTIMVILNLWRISALYTIELKGNEEWNTQFSDYKLPFDLTMGFIIYSPAIFIMLYIICKLPQFDDYLLIHEEARFSVYVFILITIVNILTAVLETQSDPNKSLDALFHVQS